MIKDRVKTPYFRVFAGYSEMPWPFIRIAG